MCSYCYKYPASAGAAPGAVTNAAVLAALFGHWKWPQVKLVFRRIISRAVPVQCSVLVLCWVQVGYRVRGNLEMNV